jgi:hypothetical protein
VAPSYANHSQITAAMKAVQKFNLTKAEKLQIINLRPTTEVEVNLVSSIQ